MFRRWGVVGVALVFLAACSSSSKATAPTTTTRPPPATGAAPWPAPPDPMARARAAGLVPRGFETLEHHVHAHLDVFVDGVAQVVPAGLGIDIHDPAVHSADNNGHPQYGGINPPCKQACISPLHTHDETGILHTESPTNADNTLGELFTEWGVKLSPTCVGGYCAPAWKVAVYVAGVRHNGDPRRIALTDHAEIAVVIGNPPAKIPAAGDFSAA
jgi:hypothetical protein